MAFGLYLHIPYCEGKCFYCDFYSKGGSRSVPESYIEALLREMRRFCNCECTSLRPDTFYFGGGTPSLLSPAQVAGSSARPPLPLGRRSRWRPTPTRSRWTACAGIGGPV